MKHTTEDLKYTLNPKASLNAAQEIARETISLIKSNCTPNFVEVQRLCETVLEFTAVQTKQYKCVKCGAPIIIGSNTGLCVYCRLVDIVNRRDAYTLLTAKETIKDRIKKRKEYKV